MHMGMQENKCGMTIDPLDILPESTDVVCESRRRDYEFVEQSCVSLMDETPAILRW